MPTPRMYIAGTTLVERPASRRTIFADGSADASMREGIDLELSHWVPNRTPERFKADTSTEICMNFLACGDRNYGLVVNNHADVDGVLSVFALVHPEPALAHRSTIIAAAGMGDFGWWGEPKAQVLFQSLTREIDTLTAADADPQVVYERSLLHVGDVIQRGFSDSEVEASLSREGSSVANVTTDSFTTQCRESCARTGSMRPCASRRSTPGFRTPCCSGLRRVRDGIETRCSSSRWKCQKAGTTTCGTRRMCGRTRRILGAPRASTSTTTRTATGCGFRPWKPLPGIFNGAS